MSDTENINFADLYLAAHADSALIKKAEAVSRKFDQNRQADSVCRLVVKAAASLLEATYPESAAFRHLKLAGDDRDPALYDHRRDLYRTVCLACMCVDDQAKSAAVGLTPAVGGAAKTLAYGALGAGASTGALYWLLARHSRQANAEVEALQQQVDYYDDLSKQLKQRMEDKYGA
jgi:hypothetical protein